MRGVCCLWSGGRLYAVHGVEAVGEEVVLLTEGRGGHSSPGGACGDRSAGGRGKGRHFDGCTGRGAYVTY